MRSRPHTQQVRAPCHSWLRLMALVMPALCGPAHAVTLGFNQQGEPEGRTVPRLMDKGYVLSNDDPGGKGLSIPSVDEPEHVGPGGQALRIEDARFSTTLSRMDDRSFDIDTIDMATRGQGEVLIEFRFVYPDGGIQTERMAIMASPMLQTVGLNRRQILRASWQQVQGEECGLAMDNVQVFEVAEPPGLP